MDNKTIKLTNMTPALRDLLQISADCSSKKLVQLLKKLPQTCDNSTSIMLKEMFHGKSNLLKSLLHNFVKRSLRKNIKSFAPEFGDLWEKGASGLLDDLQKGPDDGIAEYRLSPFYFLDDVLQLIIDDSDSDIKSLEFSFGILKVFATFLEKFLTKLEDGASLSVLDIENFVRLSKISQKQLKFLSIYSADTNGRRKPKNNKSDSPNDRLMSESKRSIIGSLRKISDHPSKLSLTCLYSASYTIINDLHSHSTEKSLWSWLAHPHSEVVQICKVQALLTVNPGFDFFSEFVFCNHK